MEGDFTKLTDLLRMELALSVPSSSRKWLLLPVIVAMKIEAMSMHRFLDAFEEFMCARRICVMIGMRGETWSGIFGVPDNNLEDEYS